MKNPALIILAILVIKNAKQTNAIQLSPLQIESAIDNIHDLIHTLERINGLSLSGLGGLPDMKKMLEVVEKIPL